MDPRAVIQLVRHDAVVGRAVVLPATSPPGGVNADTPLRVGAGAGRGGGRVARPAVPQHRSLHVGFETHTPPAPGMLERRHHNHPPSAPPTPGPAGRRTTPPPGRAPSGAA